MRNDKTRMTEGFDLQNFLPFLLNQAAESASIDFQKVYKDRYGMLRTEWRVLFHLGLFGSMTAKQIGHRAKTHKTKISRAVQQLENRRFLKRTRDDQDRRLEWLSLTPMGETAYRELRDIALVYDAKLAGQFNADEIAILRKMLRRLAGFE